jgi:hypothetical protein
MYAGSGMTREEESQWGAAYRSLKSGDALSDSERAILIKGIDKLLDFQSEYFYMPFAVHDAKTKIHEAASGKVVAKMYQDASDRINKEYGDKGQ